MQNLPETFLAPCLACGSRSILFRLSEQQKNIHREYSYPAYTAVRSHPFPEYDTLATVPTLVFIIIEKSLCPFADWERIA